jgi:hypothetical protein
MQLNAAQCLDRLTDILIFRVKSLSENTTPPFAFSFILRSEIGNDGLTTRNGFMGWGRLSYEGGEEQKILLTTSNQSVFRLQCEDSYMRLLYTMAAETTIQISGGYRPAPLCEIYIGTLGNLFDLKIINRSNKNADPIHLCIVEEIFVRERKIIQPAQQGD